MLGRLAFHFSVGSPEALEKEVIEVPSHAVHGNDVEIVDVKIPVHMCIPHLRRVDLVEPVDLAYL